MDTGYPLHLLYSDVDDGNIARCLVTYNFPSLSFFILTLCNHYSNITFQVTAQLCTQNPMIM